MFEQTKIYNPKPLIKTKKQFDKLNLHFSNAHLNFNPKRPCKFAKLLRNHNI